MISDNSDRAQIEIFGPVGNFWPNIFSLLVVKTNLMVL